MTDARRPVPRCPASALASMGARQGRDGPYGRRLALVLAPGDVAALSRVVGGVGCLEPVADAGRRPCLGEFVVGPDDELARADLVAHGAPHTSMTDETSTVHLWFKRPEAVIELGKELMSKGQTFLDQYLHGVDEVNAQQEDERTPGGEKDAG